jgi:hypothetical protein
VSLRAGAMNLNECGSFACTASAMLSSTLMPITSEVIWNERVIPRRARAWAGMWVMSRPRKRIVPASGRCWPDSCEISVVLPAPFGPMIA